MASSKLNSVGLSSKILNLYPSELSGGMQKRVSLARAICGNPSILFLDEPTTGLDPIMANIINELIVKVQEELKATTITITHDMNSAYMIAKEVAMIYQGKILWSPHKSVKIVASIREGLKVRQQMIHHVGIANNEVEIEKLKLFATGCSEECG